MGLALSPACDRCPPWDSREWRRARTAWCARPGGGRGCGQRSSGRAQKLPALLAQTEGVEAEFLNRQILVHLCRASSALPLLLIPRRPSIGVLWTAALELVTSSPLARVHLALQGAPPLNPFKIIALARCRSSRRPSPPPSSTTSLRWPPYVSPCWSPRCWVWRSWPPPATPRLVPS